MSTTARPDNAISLDLARDNEKLRQRVREIEETLEAIRAGEVDAVLVGEAGAQRIYTLESAERPYRLLIEQMQEGALTLTLEGLVLYCNESLSRMLNTPSERIVGSYFEDFVAAQDRQSYLSLLRPGVRAELALRCEGRTAIPVQISFAELAGDGAPLLCAVITDLTGAHEHATRIAQAAARHAADQRIREALEASEARFRAAVQALGGIVWTNSAEGRMQGEQPAWAALTGQSLLEYQGLGWSTALHPDDLQPTLDAWAQAVEHAKPLVFEHRVRCRDGKWRNFAVRALPRFDPAGKLLEWVGVHTDISAQRAAEDELRRADQQKDEFLAMLAHELRNPLASIGNAGELLRRVIAPSALTDSPLTILKRQTKQLSRLVDDLLDISRIARGRITLDEAVLDVGEVVDQAIETVQPMLREKQHRFHVSKVSSPIYVRGDRARLVQALSNVLHNAAKYTENGGDIRLRVLDAEANVLIEVQDNGLGIPAELLPRVFDLFVQSERTLDRSQGGLGIGLSVVKRLIEMHKGSVTADSAGAGRGATFSIRLPRAAAPVADREASRPAAGIQPRRIVIVDDNADAADSLALLLKLDGHDVHAVYNAAEALAAARRLEPEVMFLDIGLPDIDGYELARLLRDQRPREPLRLVALTGYGQQGDRERSVGAGFDEHLVKPVTLEALEQIFLP